MRDYNGQHSTHSHVRIGAYEGFGERCEQLHTHAKVTQLDLTMTIQEDIGGLDICKVGWGMGW